MPYQRSQTLEKVKAVMKNVYLAQVHQKSVKFLKMDKLCIQVPYFFLYAKVRYAAMS